MTSWLVNDRGLRFRLVDGLATLTGVDGHGHDFVGRQVSGDLYVCTICNAAERLTPVGRVMCLGCDHDFDGVYIESGPAGDLYVCTVCAARKWLTPVDNERTAMGSYFDGGEGVGRRREASQKRWAEISNGERDDRNRGPFAGFDMGALNGAAAEGFGVPWTVEGGTLIAHYRGDIHAVAAHACSSPSVPKRVTGPARCLWSCGIGGCGNEVWWEPHDSSSTVPDAPPAASTPPKGTSNVRPDLLVEATRPGRVRHVRSSPAGRRETVAATALTQREQPTPVIDGRLDVQHSRPVELGGTRRARTDQTIAGAVMCTEHRTSGGAGIIGPLVVCGVISLTVFAAFTGLFQAAVSMLPIVFAAGLVTAGGVVFAWSRSWFTTPPVLVPDGHEWGDICQVCNIAGCSVTHVLADATAHVGPVCAPCIETHGAPVDTATTAVVELAKTAELAVRAVAQGRLADADVMRFVAGGIGALPHPTSVEQLLHRAVGAQITEALTVNDQDAVVQMERLRVALIEAARERVGILR